MACHRGPWRVLGRAHLRRYPRQCGWSSNVCVPALWVWQPEQPWGSCLEAAAAATAAQSGCFVESRSDPVYTPGAETWPRHEHKSTLYNQTQQSENNRSQVLSYDGQRVNCNTSWSSWHRKGFLSCLFSLPGIQLMQNTSLALSQECNPALFSSFTASLHHLTTLVGSGSCVGCYSQTCLWRSFTWGIRKNKGEMISFLSRPLPSCLPLPLCFFPLHLNQKFLISPVPLGRDLVYVRALRPA